MELSWPISEMIGIYFPISTKRVCLFFIFRAHHQQSIMEKMAVVISSVSHPPCVNLETLPIKKVDSITRYIVRKPIARAFGTRFCKRKTVIKTVVTIKLIRSEEHTSELQSLMRISYAVFCLKKQKHTTTKQVTIHHYTT